MTATKTKPDYFSKAREEAGKEQAGHTLDLAPDRQSDLAEFLNLTAQVKELEDRRQELKDRLLGTAWGMVLGLIAQAGAMPGSVRFRGEAGTLQLVIQDKAATAQLDGKRVAQLHALVGRAAATRLVREQEEFAFRPEAFADPKIAAPIKAAINATLTKLAGTVSQAKLVNVLTCKLVHRARPDLLAHVAANYAGDPDTLAQILDVLSPACVRFIKV